MALLPDIVFKTILRLETKFPFGGGSSFTSISVDTDRKRSDLDKSPMFRGVPKRTPAYSIRFRRLNCEPTLLERPQISIFAYSSEVFSDRFTGPGIIPRELNDDLTRLQSEFIADWDDAIGNALRIKQAEFQALAFLSELTELRSLFTNAVSRFSNWLRSLVVNVSNIVLLNNLVVRPFVGDMVSLQNHNSDSYDRAVESLRRLRHPKRFYRSYKRKRKLEYEYTIEDPNVGVYVYTYTFYVVHKVGLSGKLEVDSASINYIALSSFVSSYHWDLGTTWDRIPFTFLIDYIFPIGEALASEAIDFATFIGTNGCRTDKFSISYTVDVKLSPFVNSNGIWRIVTPQQDNGTIEIFSRQPSPIEFDGATLEVVNPRDLSLTRTLNVFALIIGFVGRL